MLRLAANAPSQRVFSIASVLNLRSPPHGHNHNHRLSSSTSMASIRHFVQPEADAEFPAEKGRYHLYVTYSCPFACRALTARNLKGLQDVVSLSVAHPIFQKTRPDDASDDHKGWTFVDPETEPTTTGFDGHTYPTMPGCTRDQVLNTRFVRDIYDLVDNEPRRYTIPLLWDTKTHTIVSNESADILRMFNSGFGGLATTKVDLLPADRLEQIEATMADLIAAIGADWFAGALSQEKDLAPEFLDKTFANIQRIEDTLAKTRFLVGNSITEPDVALFHTLVRYDLAQRASSTQNLAKYPNLVNYMRDLYQTPAIKASVKWDHVELMFINFNETLRTPAGPFIDYDAPHDRARL
ncbi:Glutathione s-transferase [Globisporangium polare]